MNKTDIIKGINQKVITNVGINGRIYFDEPLDKDNVPVVIGIAYDKALIDDLSEDELALDRLDTDTLCDVEYYLDCQLEAEEKLFSRCVDEY